MIKIEAERFLDDQYKMFVLAIFLSRIAAIRLREIEAEWAWQREFFDMRIGENPEEDEEAEIDMNQLMVAIFVEVRIWRVRMILLGFPEVLYQTLSDDFVRDVVYRDVYHLDN